MFADDDAFPVIDSLVVDVWPSANWYERESFDLFGILFDRSPGSAPHPDRLRFHRSSVPQGFPFSGYVEMRYDPELRQVVYNR